MELDTKQGKAEASMHLFVANLVTFVAISLTWLGTGIALIASYPKLGMVAIMGGILISGGLLLISATIWVVTKKGTWHLAKQFTTGDIGFFVLGTLAPIALVRFMPNLVGLFT